MSSKYSYQLIGEEYLLGSKQQDFGEEIRKLAKILANPSSLTAEDNLTISQQIDALERLAKNTYSKRYPRKLNSTATGLTADQCSQVLSSEFLQYLKQK